MLRFVPIMQGHLVKWGCCWGDILLCQAETCVPCLLSFQSLCSVRWRGKRQFSMLCISSDCWASLRECQIWFWWWFSLSHSSLILFNLLTSSWNSVTKQRCSSTWAHLPEGCSRLCPVPMSQQDTACTLMPGWLHLSSGAPCGKILQSWWVQHLKRLWPSASWKPWLICLCWSEQAELSAPFPFALLHELLCHHTLFAALPRGFFCRCVHGHLHPRNAQALYASGMRSAGSWWVFPLPWHFPASVSLLYAKIHRPAERQAGSGAAPLSDWLLVLVTVHLNLPPLPWHYFEVWANLIIWVDDFIFFTKTEFKLIFKRNGFLMGRKI